MNAHQFHFDFSPDLAGSVAVLFLLLGLLAWVSHELLVNRFWPLYFKREPSSRVVWGGRVFAVANVAFWIFVLVSAGGGSLLMAAVGLIILQSVATFFLDRFFTYDADGQLPARRWLEWPLLLLFIVGGASLAGLIIMQRGGWYVFSH